MNTEPVKPSAMPIVALVLGIFGLCLAPLLMVAIVLAVISLVRANEPAYAPRKNLAIITLAMSILYIPVMVGILAAIAIPSFMKFQARAKQAECKMNLKSAYTAQRAYFAEHNAWGQTAEDIGFEPGMKTRFAYRISPQSVLPATIPGALSAEVLEGAYPKHLVEQLGSTDVLTMACAGNVDQDDGIDVWSISSEQRTVEGEVIPAGEPFNEVSDLNDSPRR